MAFLAASTAAIGSAAAADLPADPSVAEAAAEVQKVSGYVEVYGTGLQNDSYYSYDNRAKNPWWGLGGAARVNVWLASNWSSQIDLSGDVLFPGKGTSGSSYNVSGETLAAHLDWRDPSRGLFGVMLGLAGTNDYAGTGQDLAVFLGPEAQYYWDNFTLYAQGGWGQQIDGKYGGPGDYSYYKMDNIWFAQVTGRYFFTPNTKLEGSLGYISTPIWGSVYYGHTYDSDALTYSAELEQRFSHSPLSLFGRVSGFSSSNYGGKGASEVAGMLGIKVQFGTGTLLDQDRHGATLKAPDFSPLGWLRWDD